MKRVLVGITGTMIVVTAAIASSVKLNPWPSLAIITYFLSYGDQASDGALQKYVPAGIAARVDISYGSTKDEALDLYYREGTPAQPAIVWIHGGAFVAGSKSRVANYLKILAAHGYTTIAVEYSRGPGTTYPKAVEQVNAALGFVVTHADDLHVDPSTILLGGDSAGAHIAGQLALITTEPQYARAVGIEPAMPPTRLAATILLSGVYDPASLNLRGSYRWFNEMVMHAYSGVRDYREDERFKLTAIPRYVTRAFPPTFISSGNGDPLAPQAEEFARHMRQVGVHVDALFFPEDRSPRLWHEYQFNLDEPAGQQALERIWAFLDAVSVSRTSNQ
ncbi:MAG TPA: alpha/beta hydrolase [Vicinamibacterales bacterium]|nr:alpha/beta hydrolase [Vicinamibacterales bacterium]